MPAYTPQHERAAVFSEDTDLVLAMFSPREQPDPRHARTPESEADGDEQSSSGRATRRQLRLEAATGVDGDGDSAMSVEPSAVPPSWSPSTTRTQLPVERAAPAMLLPGSSTRASAPASDADSSDGFATATARPLQRQLDQAPDVHLPPLDSSEDGDRAQAHQAGRPDSVEEDDCDPSKGPASGPNALPVSPPRRIRRLPTLHQLLEAGPEDGSEEHCTMRCPPGRCTCSRRSSPAPSGMHGHGTPVAGSSFGSSTSPGLTSKGKRKRDTSYIRKCSYLQPGVVFTGNQSFTTFASAYSNPSYPTSAARDHHRRNNGYQRTSLGREPDPLYIAQPGVPSRRFIDSALDHLHSLTRQATASLNRSPFSSLMPAGPTSATSAEPESAWSAIEGSAIDPSMQDLLAGNPSYGYTSGDSIARASNTEEWEVQVSISSVDYISGRVTGVMTALNVPNSLDIPPTPSSIGPSSASLANGLDSSNTVTTSFEGEIIDLRNNGLWTRDCPNEGAIAASRSDMWEDVNEDEATSYASGSSSSCTGGPWLSSNHVVDKSTDLDYWAKLEAFASYGPLAEKEICKIAREGKWPERTKSHIRRPNPQDYILMRWKERDFIDCDARSSGLTISGFYYLCLNRKTGSLSGFYYDPLSTPHQKLELGVARTRCLTTADGRPSTSQDQQGGIWFGSYNII